MTLKGFSLERNQILPKFNVYMLACSLSVGCLQWHVIIITRRSNHKVHCPCIPQVLSPSKAPSLQTPFTASRTDVACLQQYWVGKTPYRFIGVQEIAEAFKEYKVGRTNAEALAVPYQAVPDDPALVKTKYALSSKAYCYC